LANHHTVVARADEGGRGQTRAEGIGNHFNEMSLTKTALTSSRAK